MFLVSCTMRLMVLGNFEDVYSNLDYFGCVFPFIYMCDSMFTPHDAKSNDDIFFAESET